MYIILTAMVFVVLLAGCAETSKVLRPEENKIVSETNKVNSNPSEIERRVNQTVKDF